MDFFAQYYYYLSFFCGCAFLFFSLSCFLSWRAKFGKLSYLWMMLFGVSFAVMKFVQMFIPGNNLYELGESSLAMSVALYVTMIFFFMSAQETYLKFYPEKKFVEYLIVPLSLACMIVGFCFGLRWFNMAMFLFMWLPSSVIMILSIYNMTKTDRYAKQTIYSILLFFIIYCVVYFASEAGMLFSMNVRFQAVCDALMSGIVFFIGAMVFKYFKVSHEKLVRIYDYMPVYWRHIPIGSILFIVLVGGLFFAMYLENYSKGNIEKNSRAVAGSIAETITSKIDKADQISAALSKTPFIREAMSSPSDISKQAVNAMLDNYCDSFNVPMIFAADTEGNIVFYSDDAEKQDIVNINMKYRQYFVDASNHRHGSTFTKNLLGSKQNYFAASAIEGLDGAPAGVLVIQEDIDDIVLKLKQYKNIFIVDKNGIVFLSDNDDTNFGYLWPLYSEDKDKRNGQKNVLSKEIFDGETVILNDEPFYVSREAIGDKGWSVVYFNSLSPVKQFKFLSIAGVSGALIIILLLFWIVNQSNRILALALQHKAILNSSKSIMIIATDVQGNIIVYGQGAEDILGYTKEEFERKGLENIIFSKEGKSMTFEEAVSYSSNPSTEFLNKRKDGTIINILISVLPQYSVDNKLIGYIFSGADITATKEVEIELEQQIKFLQMLMDSMPIAVYYKDSEKHLMGCNKVFEDIIEHSKDFLIGKKSEDIYFDSEAGEESKRTDDILASNLSSVTYERVVKFRKSAPRNLIYHKSAYKKIDGKFGGIIGIILDVTEERKIQEERNALQANLIQQNKLASLGELAGSIAHELNNPLSIILGFSQVLIKDASLNDEAKKGILNIYEAAKRSKSVIMNMLEFARTDTSKNQMVHINDIIESTLLIIEKDFNKAGIEIEKNLTRDKRSIIVNPMQVQQVFLNMLLNAKDSMHSGGKVAIQTYINDKYFIINIADTGIGIPKEIIQKIFDPFFTTKSVGKGTGLGLSICYGIINAHKGEISVKSAVNKGSSFIIKLPLNTG